MPDLSKSPAQAILSELERLETPLSLDTGVLNQARRHSSTAAGNRARTSGVSWPLTNKVQVGDFILLLDPVTPLPLDNRPIRLSCDAFAASAVTVCLGEVINPGELSPPEDAGKLVYASITFGTGNGLQTVEVDVAVGTRITLPTQSVEVMFFDETPRPSLNGDPVPPYHELEVSANVAYFAAGVPAVRTQQAWSPQWLGQPVGEAPNLTALFAAAAVAVV